jgi:hypothetical protein
VSIFLLQFLEVDHKNLGSLHLVEILSLSQISQIGLDDDTINVKLESKMTYYNIISHPQEQEFSVYKT